MNLARLSLDHSLVKAKSYLKRKEFQEAQKLYEAILDIFPQNKRAHDGLEALKKNKQNHTRQTPTTEIVKNLINLYNQGQFRSAFDQAQAITSQYPNTFEFWNILGASASNLNMLDKAIEAYKKCLSINPDSDITYYNIAVCFQDQGNLDEAIDNYSKSLLLNPNYEVAYNNMGNALRGVNNCEEALKAFQKAVSINPNYAEAFSNMGIALKDQGKLDNALIAFQKSISLKPNHVEAYNSIGNIFKEQGKLEEAIKAYKKCLNINPNYETARAHKLFQEANICDWRSINKDRQFISQLGTLNEAVSPFAMLILEDAPERHRIRSEVYAKEQYFDKSLSLPVIQSNKLKRIRIGYFSADFHNHATMHLIAKVFEAHDKHKFEIFVYSYGPENKDKMRYRLINSVDVFNDVREMSDKDIALLARQDKIDCAIDLKGYTQNQRLGIFSYRPAPIQISYLGYPGTTGTNFIDYIIADPIVIPDVNQFHFSEKIIYLPNSYQPNDNTRSVSAKISSRKDMGLHENDFVFCCFNNNYKITSVEFDIWMRLLAKIENSVFWLLKSNHFAENNLKSEAEKRGISKNRLVFAKKLPQDEHLERHKHADLFVDTFNVNAHTTASDALWAGLPVVTKLGNSFASRVGGSLLNAIGLPELVTENKKDYECLILNLATKPSMLNNIKEKLASNRSTHSLFNTEQYTKQLENSYQKAYENYLKGSPPKNIKII